jgi:alkylation response protein AidB-like acyl-CoA dehydrogenase
MDLHPTEDQEAILAAAQDYLSRELPADRAPQLTETALTPAQWCGLADMGWFAMGLPENRGGLGLSVVEEAFVLREFGRNLVPPQALATMVAAHLAAALGEVGLVQALAGGQSRAAIAVPLAPAADGPSAGEYRLVDTAGADLVVGWSQAGAFLAPVEAFKDRLAAPPLDATLEISTTVGLDVAQVRWRGADPAFHARASVMTAAVLTGGAEAVRDIAGEYAKVRHQFGQPIGRFQAVAHPIAEMAVRAESALACLFYAAVCQRDGLAERDLFCASARSVAFHANYLNAKAAMQVHGGYGQTYEYLPHFYLKRAMIYGQVGGGVEADEDLVLAAPALF